MPVNASPHYAKAELEYLSAETTPQKIKCLKKMLAVAPKHKGAENLLKQLKTRLAKLKYTDEKESKSKKHSSIGIKKSDMQAVIIGKTNSGKSSLLKQLTNAKPPISTKELTTRNAQIGMMNYATTQIQIIENPAIESPQYDKGLTHTADTLLIVVTNLEEIQEIKSNLTNTTKNQRQIIVFNKVDILDTNQQRRLEATLKSRKYEYQLVSTKSKYGLEELKGKIFQSFNKLRVYTKDPTKKQADMSKPVILEPKSTVKDVAEKILHGFSKNIKQIKIWGPSSKFAGQGVGLTHQVRDGDIVEFKTR
jgi:ribosome-interacting GTPase 1